MNISKRLINIADYVPHNANVLDIGCDHALLDIYLVKEKKIGKSLVSDISQNALDQAIYNIKKYQLEDKILTILSNGLKNVDLNDINTIIISGLGGVSIANILSFDRKKLCNVKNIILQPNNNAYHLRKKMIRLGYYIYSENLVKENNIIYPTIFFKSGIKKYSRKQLYFGPILLKNKNKLFLELFNSELNKKILVYNRIPLKHFIKKIIFKLEIIKINREVK